MFALYLLGLAALALVLGFVALLRQKSYLDPETKAPLEVEVPLFGRMKANFPALLFVFFAGVFAFMASENFEQPGIKRWIVRGGVFTTGNIHIPRQKWKNLVIRVEPSQYSEFIKKEKYGRFRLNFPLIEGTHLEKAISWIVFEFPTDETYATCIIDLQAEKDLYDKDISKNKSVIKSITADGWLLKNISLGLPSQENGDPPCQKRS
jgi:hypothetical protein